MFSKYLLFNLLCCFSFINLVAQDLDKMNKSELRSHVILLNDKIDSLKKEVLILEETKSKLYSNYTTLEKKDSVVNLELIRIKADEKQRKSDIEKLNSDVKSLNDMYNAKISSLNDTIQGLKISSNADFSELNASLTDKEKEIEGLNAELILTREKLKNQFLASSSEAISNSTSSPSLESRSTDDFLNKYFFTQFPLNNNTYSLILSKVIYLEIPDNESYGYRNSRYDDDFDNNNNSGTVLNVPEILDANVFTYWGVKPNISFSSGSKFNDFVIAKKSDYLNSKLPKIEVLKNKLFTLKYNDGTEESFLFNIKKFDQTETNNQRSVLQIELANEEVKSDGTNNTARDIVWRFFVIDSETYLALSFGQINRINANLHSFDAGLIVRSKSQNKVRLSNYYNSSDYITTGEGIYMSRDNDAFMKGSKYINPSDLTFLFKLK